MSLQEEDTERTQVTTDRGRDGDVSAFPGRQVLLAATGSQRRQEGSPSRTLGGSGSPANTLILDMGPRKCEKINVLSKPPGLW